MKNDQQGQIEAVCVRVTRAAKMLDVSKSAIYEAIHTGKIRAVRVGQSLRIPMAEITRLVDAPGVGAKGLLEATDL